MSNKFLTLTDYLLTYPDLVYYYMILKAYELFNFIDCTVILNLSVRFFTPGKVLNLDEISSI